MKLKIAILVSTLFIVSINCKKDGATEAVSQKANVILPMALNNMWIYRISQMDSSGNIIKSWIDTTKVTKDTIVNNEKWYAPEKEPNEFMTNRTDGLYGNVFSPKMEYKYPASIGDSILLSWGFYRKVVSINDTITVNGKLYHAYKTIDDFPSDPNVSSYINYYVPNIGQVKLEAIANNLKSHKYIYMTLELISYKLN